MGYPTPLGDINIIDGGKLRGSLSELADMPGSREGKLVP